MQLSKQIFILLFTLLLIQGASAQTPYTEIYPGIRISIDKEKLDVSRYRNKYKGSILDYSETMPDGTLLQIKSYGKTSTIEVFEKPPLPAIHIIYKEFYANGDLKQKGVFLPLQFKVGKWIECSQSGSCTITDHEVGRNTYSYNDILEYLEMKKIYGNANDNVYECPFWYTPESHTWGVRINKDGNQYKMFEFDSKGQNEVKEYELTPKASAVTIIGTFEQEEE